MMEQSLVDDARTAYDYGLPTASSPPSTDFSFVDQRVPRPTHHQNWFPPQIQGNPHPAFFNRSFSMPQGATSNFISTDQQRLVEEQQMAAATLLMQQQNWARQQQTSTMYPGQPFEQVRRSLILLCVIDKRCFFIF